MNRRQWHAVLALVAAFQLSVPAYAWKSSSADGHGRITEDAVRQTGDSYPDVFTNLKAQVKAGSIQTEGAGYETTHLNDGARKTKQEYWGTDHASNSAPYSTFWIEGMDLSNPLKPVYYGIEKYRRSNGRNAPLQAAYTDFGKGIHLIQDAQVPAHFEFCPHGYFGGFSYHKDGVEESAGAHWGYKETHTTPHTFVSRRVTYTYWLYDDSDDDDGVNGTVDANDGTADDRGNYGVPSNYCHVGSGRWGTYGYVKGDNLPGNSNCDDTGDRFDNETGGGANQASAVAILQEHLFLARKATEDKLIEISKRLPPLPTDIDVTSADHTFRAQTGNTRIKFTVWDNRKKTADSKVKITVKVGGVVIKDMTCNIWDDHEIALNANGTTGQLPFRKAVKIDWDGMTADGSYLAAGTYAIEVIATDDEDTPNSCSSNEADPDDAGRSYVTIVN